MHASSTNEDVSILRSMPKELDEWNGGGIPATAAIKTRDHSIGTTGVGRQSDQGNKGEIADVRGLHGVDCIFCAQMGSYRPEGGVVSVGAQIDPAKARLDVIMERAGG